MIPTKPDLFKDLQGIKKDVERDIGTKIDWNSFILGVLDGAAGTGLDIAIGKAIRKYRKEKKNKTK